MIADYGIYLEVAGFILIAIVGLPGRIFMTYEGHGTGLLSKYVVKIEQKIPTKLKDFLRDITIPLVVAGLFLQQSEINNLVFNYFPTV